MYIFNPKTAVSKISKATSQPLLNSTGLCTLKKLNVGSGILPVQKTHISRWISAPVSTLSVRKTHISRWIIAPVSTLPLAVRSPLPEIFNVEGEVGRNAKSLPSVDALRGVQLRYASLQTSDISGFPSSFELDDEKLVSRTDKVAYTVSGQDRCRFRRMQNTSECAYWSAPTVERPGLAGRTPPWTGCFLHAAGLEWSRMWRRSSNTALTAWMHEEGGKSRAVMERRPTEPR